MSYPKRVHRPVRRYGYCSESADESSGASSEEDTEFPIVDLDESSTKSSDSSDDDMDVRPSETPIDSHDSSDWITVEPGNDNSNADLIFEGEPEFLAYVNELFLSKVPSADLSLDEALVLHKG